MIAVIFEVRPYPGRMEEYLSVATDLRPLLDNCPGFVSVERFQSLTDPGKLLSLSFFRDEESVRHWRNLSEHRDAQDAGRDGIFANYQIRVAEIQRDYGLNDREHAPVDSRKVLGE